MTDINVPTGMEWFAKLHGAVFDEGRGCWSVSGDVPPELVNFLPRTQYLPVRIRPPSCPNCGTPMIKQRSARTGVFWGCSNYWGVTRCKGSRSLQSHPEWLKDLSPETSASAPPGAPQAVCRAAAVAPDLERRIRRIVQLAVRVLGTEDTQTWFERPKVGLGSRAPVTLLHSRDGRRKVVQLLIKISKQAYG